MLKVSRQHIKNLVHGKRGEKSLELTLQLDSEARVRFEKLRNKMPRADETQIVALALKCLEQKWDIIVKWQAIKRVRTLKNEGMNNEQIAKRLNDEHFPTPSVSDYWSGDLISHIRKDEKVTDASKHPVKKSKKGLKS